MYPTYKESFQVRWDNSIQFFPHAAIYLEVSLFVEPVRMHFSAKQPCRNDTVCNAAMQYGETVGYCYPSGLEKTLCKWDTYVPLVTKGLK
jgi:hypothetical protein